MKNISRVIIFIFCLTSVIAAEKTANPKHDESRYDNLSDFVQGKYLMIGRSSDGKKVYSGNVRISFEKERNVVRVINGKTIRGNWEIIEFGCDEVLVLRMRFVEKMISYEAIFLITTDLENYPRLTGEVYESDNPARPPALEALFPVHE
ncbi:MAG TPA: hypothetical protein VF857_07860 [Spirochaetota bacterium]